MASVRIPTREPVSSVPSGRIPVADGVARGLEELGAAGFKAGLEAAERGAALEAQRQLADVRDTWSKRLIEEQQAAPLGAAGFTDRIEEAFDEDRSARLDSVAPAVRPWLEARLDAERNHLVRNAAAFEAASATEKHKQDTLDIVQLQANAVRTDGSMFEDALTASRAAIEGSGLDAPSRAALTRDAELRVASAWIQGLNEIDPHAAKKALESGAVDGFLTPEAKNVLVNDNQVELRRRDAAAKAAVADARGEVRDVVKLLEDGFDPGLERLQALSPIAAADKDLAGDLDVALQLYEFQRGARGMTPADLQGWINGERTRLDGKTGVTTAEAARVQLAETLLTRMNAAIAKDPLSWASRAGVREVPPLELVGDAAEASVARRRKDAEAVARYYGVPPRYLTDEEATQLTALVASQDPDTQLGVIATVGEAFGDAAPAVFEEFAKSDGGLFAHAAGLAGTGSPQAARDVLVGARARKDGISLPPRTDLDTEADSEVAGAFTLAPGMEAAHRDAAEAIYLARAARRGLTADATARFDDDLWRRSLQEAAGAVYTRDGERWGGIVEHNGWNVVVPSEIRADQFDAVVARIRDKDLAGAAHGNGAPFTADELSESWLVSVGHGKYWISQTDPAEGDPVWIGAAGGTRPWELDLTDDGLLPALLARITGIPAPPEAAGLPAPPGEAP